MKIVYSIDLPRLLASYLDVGNCCLKSAICQCGRRRGRHDIVPNMWMEGRTSPCWSYGCGNAKGDVNVFKLIMPSPQANRMHGRRVGWLLLQPSHGVCFILFLFFPNFFSQAASKNFVHWLSPKVTMAPQSRKKLPLKRALKPQPRRQGNDDYNTPSLFSRRNRQSNDR